jgi:hypothetical protein
VTTSSRASGSGYDNSDPWSSGDVAPKGAFKGVGSMSDETYLLKPFTFDESCAQDRRAGSTNCEYHPRCLAIRAQRKPPGKLCFMELIDAVAAALPRNVAVGDIIDAASWGQFVVRDDYARYWLNDYSVYFLTTCGSSWEQAVVLYLDAHYAYRPVSAYLCRRCNGDRSR